MPEDLNLVLASLRPDCEGKVIDLVRDAGVDVGPWSVTKDGAAVEKPRANPAYCYEWSFGGGDEPTVLCVWHQDAKVSDGRICYEDNLRTFADKLDAVVFNRASTKKDVFRSKSQAGRGRDFDRALQRASYRKQQIRIILLVGEDSGAYQIGKDTSKVHFRALDPEPWFVEHYDMNSGEFRLVRGRPTETAIEDGAPDYVDQFSLPVPPERVPLVGTALPRSRDVRQSVLNRAKGVCEYCGQEGFRMANGAIYLETHHVFPLSAAGPDVEWNVVAICPNDHRRAHFAVEREQIRAELLNTLTERYPGAREPLRALLVASEATS